MDFNPKNIILGVSLAASLSCVGATPVFKAYDAEVTVNEQTGMLDISLDLRMKDFKIGRNGEVVYTPVVISENGSDSLQLAPFTVCGRNRYYWYMREGVLDSRLAPIYRSGSKETVRISESVPLAPWMLDNGTVELRQAEATCCSAPKMIPGNSRWGNVEVARLHPVAPSFSDVEYVFAPPVEDEPVKRSIEGKAFVTFVVNKTDLNPDYMDNPSELRKITGSIDFVKADPDAVITEIHIRGYASPEGSYENNTRLAKGRTETLASYVNGLYRFAPGIMTTSYDPEDWGGLRSYVADSLSYPISDRQALLEVIDGPLGYDAKDQALKTRFPKDYKVLLNDIYPWLRHSDYQVKYNIKVYTDIADLMRLYSTDPTKLRAVDFFTIAKQYPEDSPQYHEVMRKAVEVYPDAPMLNLNMANIYLQEGDLEAAQACLLKAGRTPQADYARGILAARRGDYGEAEKWLKMASESGIPQAADCLKRFEESAAVNPVEMLLPLGRR